MPYPKEFSVVLFILLIALLAYLLMIGKLTPWSFMGGLLLSAIVVGVMHNLDVLSRLVVRGGGYEASVEMRQLRDDVFAKAKEVQRLAEQVTSMIAWGIANTGRFVGDDFQAQLLVQREELRRMLKDLKVSEERSAQLVLPITTAVANDYRHDLLRQAWQAIVDSAPGTDEQRKTKLHEIEQVLNQADQLAALEQLEKIIAEKNIEQPKFRKSLERYRTYLRENPVISSRR
ncbi:MAG: hypothetical protein ACREIJ_03540 [Nitrospiraceae bacterium]